MKEILRNEKLNIRITSSEKNKISKRAEILNMSISNYSRMNMLVKSQEMVNYIQKTYGNDGKLERMMDKLWEID